MQLKSRGTRIVAFVAGLLLAQGVAPVKINGTLTLDFVVDSGAADVSLPADVVTTLFRTGTLKDSDFIGSKTYQLANGSTMPSATFRLASLEIGGHIERDITASVSPVSGVLLLGQSYLSRFQSWSFDNRSQSLVLVGPGLGQPAPPPMLTQASPGLTFAPVVAGPPAGDSGGRCDRFARLTSPAVLSTAQILALSVDAGQAELTRTYQAMQAYRAGLKTYRDCLQSVMRMDKQALNNPPRESSAAAALRAEYSQISQRLNQSMDDETAVAAKVDAVVKAHCQRDTSSFCTDKR